MLLVILKPFNIIYELKVANHEQGRGWWGKWTSESVQNHEDNVVILEKCVNEQEQNSSTQCQFKTRDQHKYELVKITLKHNEQYKA